MNKILINDKKMKILNLIILLLIAIPSFAANSVDVTDTIPVSLLKAKDNTGAAITEVIVAKVVYDTPNEDLVILNPAGAGAVGVVGMQLADDAGSVITYKSGANTIVEKQYGTAFDISVAIENRLFLTSLDGENLVFRASTALPEFTMYVIVYKQFGF